MIRFSTAAMLVACLAPAQGQAASEDAWAAFREDVSARCLAAASELFEAPRAIVDPFGSARFGLALVTGRPRGGEGEASAICVYDKATKVAEIGGELPQDR